MIKVMIITHGSLGEELFKTAETIVGKQEDIVLLTLGQHEGLAALCQRTGTLLKQIEPNDGVLIFTDMLGGTPCNACLPYCSSEHNIEIVSGVNLYMLLSAFINRKNLELKELSEKVILDGQKNIANAKDIFLKKLK